ncbi:hypothetical protein [Kribbella sp. NPDC004875]|uniref:hypothetical protein n=1 Tax=Kribbella sp. NPDC004875 TaxID=3364107 RepID=UPI0036C10CA7
MADEPNQHQQGTVASIAAGVSGFVSRPGATVRVIAKRSAADWQRYSRRVGNTFAETEHLTETLRRGLPGIDRGPGWRSQRAAVDALAHQDAEYALVAEVGDDGPMTVVTFRRDNDDLVVVGGGTTFPPAAVLGDVSLPSGEQAGYATQYALASIAARETLNLSHQVSPDTWHGPRALEARRMIWSNGQAGSTKSAAQTWTADDVRHIAEQVALRQADGRDPFPQVQSAVAGGQGPRRWATELKGWLDRGGTLEVYDHADPMDRDAAGLAMLEIVPGSHLLAQNPLPDKPGVRTLVAMADGRPRGLITTGQKATGDVHVLRFLGTADVGAKRAIEFAMLQSAGLRGGAVSFSEAGAIEYMGNREYSVSSADAKSITARMESNLRHLDKESAARLAEVLKVLDTPTVPSADPAALAAGVQRFREAGGDVLLLGSSDPRLADLRERASDEVWAAAGDADGSVQPGVDGMWRALNSEESHQLVAVAVLDGAPVAAASVRNVGPRWELGTFGAVPGADDALTAAVVDGVYERSYRQTPVTMFLTDAEAASEQLPALGLQVTDVRPLDDETRVQVFLPDATRVAIVSAEAKSGWPTARGLDQVSQLLTDFREANGSVRRLDHAVDADRELATEIVRDVQSDNKVKQSEIPVPPVNGNRVTVAAQSDEHGPAYITFDETPDGGIEVVDVAAKGYDYTAREATRYWFCDQTTQRGQEPVLHERMNDIERARGTWETAPSRYFVTGMQNRLGDRAAALVTPATEPEAPGSQTLDRGSLGVQGDGQAPGRRPEGPRGRRGDLGR